MNRLARIISLLLAFVLVLSACGQSDNNTTTDNTLKSQTAPFFNNDYDNTRSTVPESEEYLNYSVYVNSRHSFNDMLYHEAEVAAVTLAQDGIFEKSESFEPDSAITVRAFAKAVLQLAGKADADTADEKIDSLCADTLLAEEGAIADFNAALTWETMAYLLDRACADAENTAQYKLVVGAFDRIDSRYQESVLQCIALGILPSDAPFGEGGNATRADAALGLWRLSNAGMRLVVPYNIGNYYKDGQTTYLVKNTYETNESGLQIGTWSYYNKQAFTFSKLGKRPIERVNFHKWCNQELSKGVYTFPDFANEKKASEMGSTVITSVEIAANKLWNPDFHQNIIPSFYETDITNEQTRRAAKNYLYSFVQALLTEVKGDVMLAIDYEVDWEMALYGPDPASRERAAIWGDWYEEACEVVRSAAKQMGAENRIKLIVIYNNVTAMHKLGKGQNEWMIKAANASDVVGIDIYFQGVAADNTVADCAKQLVQDIRFLINNYSLGKPVMIVENGVTVGGNLSEEGMKKYYQELFREFEFSLGKDEFLGLNLSAYMFWDIIRFDESDMGTGASTTGIYYKDGSPTPAASAVIEGISRLEGTRIYNPSVLTGIENLTEQGASGITVSSGTEYQSLTYLTKLEAGKKTLRVKLKGDGTVFITVNGKHHYASSTVSDRHVFEITEGITEGMNCIEIFFGSSAKPFTQTVEIINFK